MISSPEEFVRLRASRDPEEYRRAAHDEASLEVWEDVLARYPEMSFWVAHNKTVPAKILRRLATSADTNVRGIVARKNKLPQDMFVVLATDRDEGVRAAIARHKRTPAAVRQALLEDRVPMVREAAQLGAARDDTGAREPS